MPRTSSTVLYFEQGYLYELTVLCENSEMWDSAVSNPMISDSHLNVNPQTYNLFCQNLNGEDSPFMY